MISSAKPPPFVPEYSRTKIEAENFILNECPDLIPTIIRPGFIVDKNHRVWSPPLSVVVDLLYYVNVSLRSVAGERMTQPIDFLFPAKSTKLTTISHFAREGALGLN